MTTTTADKPSKQSPKARREAAQAAARERRRVAKERKEAARAREYADAMNKAEPGDRVVDGQAVGLDNTIRAAAEAIGNGGVVGPEKKAHVIAGQAFELAAQVRGLVGKHGAKYKDRLVRALKDEKDPLYDVLRKAGKRVLMKTVMGD